MQEVFGVHCGMCASGLGTHVSPWPPLPAATSLYRLHVLLLAQEVTSCQYAQAQCAPRGHAPTSASNGCVIYQSSLTSNLTQPPLVPAIWGIHQRLNLPAPQNLADILAGK